MYSTFPSRLGRARWSGMDWWGGQVRGRERAAASSAGEKLEKVHVVLAALLARSVARLPPFSRL